MDKQKQILINNSNIKKCLKRYNCTLKELANTYGVSITAVSHWFDGDMSLTRAQSIAEYLDITIDELINGEKPEPQTECDTVTIQGKKYKVTFTPIDE